MASYAMLCILFTTGCHAAEVANLRCGHIVKTKNSIAITTRQKGGKDRRYTLKKYTAQALIKYLTAIYNTECSPDAPVWLSFARNETKGFALGKSAISDICKKWLGTSKIEVTYRTFEAIQKKHGQIGLENIEKLLGIEEKDNELS